MSALRLNSALLLRAARRGRWLHGLLVAIVALQLIGAGVHRHDLMEESGDCVSCYLVAHVPSPLPPADLAPAPVVFLVRYSVAPRPVPHIPARPDHLLPHAQAPPAA